MSAVYSTESWQSQPVVWTIAGSDSGGGAGIQADLASFRSFGCHGCSVITTVTAQNSVAVTGLYELSIDTIAEQLDSLLQDMPPAAIKIGLLSNNQQLGVVTDFLKRWPNAIKRPFIVWDPVMITTQNDRLSHLTQHQSQQLLAYVDLVTPNADELAWLSGLEVINQDHALTACESLIKSGVTAVLTTGLKNNSTNTIVDLYVPKRVTVSESAILYRQPQVATDHNHGTGCTLSSAICAVIALGYPIEDAITLANAYVHSGLLEAKGIGQGPGPVSHTGWPSNINVFPDIQMQTLPHPGIRFPSLNHNPTLYPVVDSFEWVQRLLQLGIKTLQLRIKKEPTESVEHTIHRSIELAKSYSAQLFINDHWQLAIKHGAYGVHLGQEDLAKADLLSLQNSGLRLGISTHSYLEILIARRYKPSYIALGHIFPTQTKDMPSEPQGLKRLQRYVSLLKPTRIPTVAIGGISKQRVAPVKKTGVTGVALVSAITQASNTEAAVNELHQELEVANAD